MVRLNGTLVSGAFPSTEPPLIARTKCGHAKDPSVATSVLERKVDQIWYELDLGRCETTLHQWEANGVAHAYASSQLTRFQAALEPGSTRLSGIWERKITPEMG